MSVRAAANLGLLIPTLVCAFAHMTPAQAQELRDPTRPPVAVRDTAVEAGSPAPAAKLQSVLVSSVRRVAVIDGKTVRQGGKFHEATVLKIGESFVVLRYPDREERLELLPGIEKRLRNGPKRTENNVSAK